MVWSIMCIQQMNWKNIQASSLSLLMAGIKNQESHFVKPHLHSLHGTTSLQIHVVAHVGALQKDVDAFGMGLAAARIAIAANPALTRKTASLKNVSLYSWNYIYVVIIWNGIVEDVDVKRSKTKSSSKWTIHSHTIANVIDDSLARLSRICSGRPQWLLEAKIDSYKLYDKSMLTLILKNGWVSDDVSW